MVEVSSDLNPRNWTSWLREAPGNWPDWLENQLNKHGLHHSVGSSIWAVTAEIAGDMSLLSDRHYIMMGKEQEKGKIVGRIISEPAEIKPCGYSDALKYEGLSIKIRHKRNFADVVYPIVRVAQEYARVSGRDVSVNGRIISLSQNSLELASVS